MDWHRKGLLIPVWFPSCQPEGRDWLREHGIALQAVERKQHQSQFHCPLSDPNGGGGAPPLAGPRVAASYTKPPLLPMVKVAPPSIGLLVGLLPN